MSRCTFIVSLFLAMSSGIANSAEPASPPLNPDWAKVATDVKMLAERLDRLESSVNRLMDQLQTQSDLARVKQQLEVFSKEIETLKARNSVSNVTTSNYQGTALATNGSGTLLLQNRFFTPMEVLVNGNRYIVAPFQSQSISMPAGAFSLQVPQTQPFATMRVIRPNEVYTVTNQ